MMAPRGKNLLDLSIKGKWWREIPSGSPFGRSDTQELLESVGEAGACGAGSLFWVWVVVSSKQRRVMLILYEFLCKNHLLVVAVRSLLALGWVVCWWPGLSLVSPSHVAGCSSWWLCHCHSTCYVSWWHPGILGCLRHPRGPSLMEFGLLIRMVGEEHRKLLHPRHCCPSGSSPKASWIWFGPIHPWTSSQRPG